MDVDEAVDGGEVGAVCGLVLLFGLFEVAVEHLQDGILAVNIALVRLRKDLNVLAQLLQLCEAHDTRQL